MGKIDISIIVAVYNTEKYVGECIESVLAQSFCNWELWLVDDGSTDSSGEICERYKLFDNRIKVIHQKNGGQSVARNRALDRCSGDYYVFMDSDDKLADKALENMYNSITKNCCDMCFGGIKRFGKKIETLYNTAEDESILTPEMVCRRMFIRDGLDSNTVAKIYKADLWKKQRFPEGVIFEDVPIMYKIILQCNRIACCKHDVYMQRRRSGSTTRMEFSEKRKKYVEFSYQVYRDICKYYPQLEKEAYVYYLISVVDNYINLSCSSNRKKYKFYRRNLNSIIRKNESFMQEYSFLSKQKSRIVICRMGMGRICNDLYRRIRNQNEEKK